ncbi:hypothetical protein VBM87_01260 [Mycoplasma sp. 744]|uniref:hypothetical protein n=1 Tax=unclassified Mycoplasma TaxID=2683645 RepID=UPI00211BB768|nr:MULTISPECIES: hypothetical protein [unclassified Mycoplasma]MEA4115409.1 hypothetical protein [Mycoplasma sp. 744]UUM19412.1 hypothetical protein NPA14_00875 [Mycoplasma sp. 1018B]
MNKFKKIFWYLLSLTSTVTVLTSCTTQYNEIKNKNNIINRDIIFKKDEISKNSDFNPIFKLFVENLNEPNNLDNIINLYTINDLINNRIILNKNDSWFINYIIDKYQNKSWMNLENNSLDDYQFLKIIFKTNINDHKMIENIIFKPAENNINIDINFNTLSQSNNEKIKTKRLWLLVPKIWNTKIENIQLSYKQYLNYSDIKINELFNNGNLEDFYVDLKPWELNWNKNNIEFDVKNTNLNNVIEIIAPTIIAKDKKNSDLKEKFYNGEIGTIDNLKQIIAEIKNNNFSENDKIDLTIWSNKFIEFINNNKYTHFLVLSIDDAQQYGLTSLNINKEQKKLILNSLSMHLGPSDAIPENDAYYDSFYTLRFFLFKDFENLEEFRIEKIIKKYFHTLDNKKQYSKFENIIFSPYIINTQIIKK